MDIKAIQEIIPHRPPFLLLTRVDEVEPGVRAKGVWQLSGDEYFFSGHFPNNPVLPGVLMLESLAQLGAVMLLSHEAYRGKTAYFGSLGNARFRRKVLPGETLTMEVEMLKLKGPVGKGHGIAYVNGEKACETDMTFAVDR